MLLWGCLIVLSSILTFDPKLYINGDNVEYINLAQAAREGRLWASPKYPPFFAWLLVLPQAAFGLALLPQKIFVAILHAASGLLLLRRARSLLPRGWGEPVAWVAMTLVPVLEFGHYVMSEIPYLLFSLLGLEALDRMKSQGGARFAILAALAAAATFYTRSVGLALWAALAIAVLIDRRPGWRPRAIFAGLSGLLFLPWALRVLLGPRNPYFRQLIQVNPIFPEFGVLDLAGWVTRIAGNVKVYLLGEIPTGLLPVIFRWTYDSPERRYHFLPWFVGLVPLALMAIGLVLAIRKREPLGLYLVLYTIITLMWPEVWSGLRFLVPVLPLFLLLLFRGLLWLAERLRRRVRRAQTAAAVLLVLWILLGIRNQAILSQKVQSYPPDWNAYFKIAEWIKTRTKPDDLIVDRKPAILRYVTGRRVVTFPREADPKKMLEWMDREGADYVVLAPIPYDDVKRFLIPAVVAEQTRFEPAFEIEEPYAVLLRLRR